MRESKTKTVNVLMHYVLRGLLKIKLGARRWPNVYLTFQAVVITAISFSYATQLFMTASVLITSITVHFKRRVNINR